jgi:hypothetical protein
LHTTNKKKEKETVEFYKRNRSLRSKWREPKQNKEREGGRLIDGHHEGRNYW